MKLPIVEFISGCFTLTDGGKTLVSEASDMWNRHLQKLSTDGPDVGFAVKSSETGHIVIYVMSEVMKDEEGEVTGWKYLPSPESVKEFPECASTKAVVFND